MVAKHMIERRDQLGRLTRALRRAPVVGLLGARQVGKSTLAHQLEPDHFYDLENPRHLARLGDAMAELEPLKGLVVLDEIQRRPEIFPVLRVLADRRPRLARFLVLGSASPALLRQTSESLAGRIELHELGGLSLTEVGAQKLDLLWLRGGFPASFLARNDPDSLAWRGSYVRTVVERDLPQLGITVPATTLERFWQMLAHVHGGILNWSELGRSMGVTDMTVRHYLDILAQAFLVRVLKPWHENIGKRQVKSPKVYLRDSGVLHALLDIETARSLSGHPKAGPSWEGFCIEQLVARLGAEPHQCFFWATQQGAELDLLIIKGARRFGYELKLSSAPTLTPSMRIAVDDLRLDELLVIHRGTDAFRLAPKIRAVPASRLVDLK
ncbi:MAG: ATP-binding protein [Myxococcaceae bacterium]